MDRFIVNIVLKEVFIHAGEEGHLRQGEDVHELLHGVSMRTLQAGRRASETETNTTAKPDLTFTRGDSGHQHLDPSPQEKDNSNNNKVEAFALFLIVPGTADDVLYAQLGYPRKCPDFHPQKI